MGRCGCINSQSVQGTYRVRREGTAGETIMDGKGRDKVHWEDTDVAERRMTKTSVLEKVRKKTRERWGRYLYCRIHRVTQGFGSAK